MPSRSAHRIIGLGAALVAAALAGAPAVTMAVPAGAATSSTTGPPATPFPLAFVADSGTNRLVEVDAASGAIVTSIAVGTAPAAVAVTPNGATAWVANRGSDNVTPVAVSSGTAGTPVAVGSSPDAIAITPAGTLALVADNGSGTITPIALGTGSAPEALNPITVGGSGSGPDAIAVTPAGKTAYVADYGAGQVVPVDLATDEAGSPITVGTNPSALAITPDGTTLLVANHQDGTVSAVDTANDQVSTITVGAGPDAIAVTPAGSTAYVADATASTVTPLSIGASATTADPAFNVATDPTGVAFTPAGSLAYVVSLHTGNATPVTVSAGSGTAGTPISLPTGTAADGSPSPVPVAVAFLPDQGPRASLAVTAAAVGSPTSFSAQTSVEGSMPITSYAWTFGDGTHTTTTVPDTTHIYPTPGTYEATVTLTDADAVSTTTVFTGQTASGNGSASGSARASVTVGPATADATPIAYVSGGANGTLVPVQLADDKPGPALDLGGTADPTAVALTPDGSQALVADKADDLLRVVSTASARQTASVAVGSEPVAVAVTPAGTTAYVANAGSASVSVVDLASQHVSTISVGTDPDAVAVSPSGARLYVADAGTGTITVVDTATMTTVGTLTMPGSTPEPAALAITPDGGTLWVADKGEDQVVPVTTAGTTASPQGSVGTPVTTGIAPTAVAITRTGGTLVVVSAGLNGTGSVTPIGIGSASPQVGTPYALGGSPVAVAVAPDATTVLVTEQAGNVVLPLGLASTAAGAPSLSAGGTPVVLPTGTGPDAVAVVPDQHPVAHLLVTPGPAGSPTVLDAAASSAPASPIATYAWTFGDGSVPATTASSSISHIYAAAGNYTASVTVTDKDGISTTTVFTGQTASGNGGASATASERFSVAVPPAIGPPGLTSVDPALGSTLGGDKVTITGTTFTGTSAVHFGTAPATSITSIGPTSIVVTAPPHAAGPVTVTVTNTIGTSTATPADVYTYYTPPAVSSLRLDSGPTGGGVAVTIAGSHLAGATAVHFGTEPAARIVSDAATSLVVVTPAGSPGTVDVTVSGPGGTSPAVAGDRYTFVTPAPSGVGGCGSTLPAGSVVGMAASPTGQGYWVTDAAGDVAAFGDAVCYGSMSGHALSAPVVGMAADPVTGGYWLVAADGGIFSFNAPFLGSTGAMHLNAPIVGMTAMPDGLGYRFVAADGGVFDFGDASFYGSMGASHLNEPVVGMAATNDGDGYWLVASDGGIFDFGDAPFYGSMGNVTLNKPVVGMAADPATGGYWLVAADGGVFSFHAPFFGSTGTRVLNRPIVGMTAQPQGNGYRFVASDGGIFDFGTAGFFGSAVGP